MCLWMYVCRVRDLKTNVIGALVSFGGTVTRSSEVRPELLYGVFKCELCSALSGKVEQQFKYTEPSICSNQSCPNRTKWQVRATLLWSFANSAVVMSEWGVRDRWLSRQSMDPTWFVRGGCLCLCRCV